MSSLIPRPGAAFGVYPERERPQTSWLQQSASRAALRVEARFFPSTANVTQVIAEINNHVDDLAAEKRTDFKLRARALREQFARQGQTDALAIATFALVRKVVEKELGLQLFDEQLMGGWVMFKGKLAEMAPGEGKTLATLLPACTAALAGIPVHVVSANDHLAQRDASLLKQVYAALGISMGLVATNTPTGQRRAAYQCDVTYCSSRQVAFDYLQDRVLMQRHSSGLRLQLERLNKENTLASQLRLRGLCYAIIDDADSILIDESLNPLILSRSGRTSRTPDELEGDTLARITFPRFFQRYVKLCGTAANLREVATEMHTTYGLVVQSIAPRAPNRRHIVSDRVYVDQASKWQAICDHVVEKYNSGQPVLVGTRNGADSEHLGQLLTAAGVPHLVLETIGDRQAAQSLARAGTEGAVTVTSTLIGHSTDISLDRRVQDLGGLHVILGERRQAARIDDHFIGLCARRGEPGSAIAMLSLEDSVAQQYLPHWVRSLLQRGQLPGARHLLSLAQKKQQRLEARARQRLLAASQQLDDLLAFSGRAT